jgi:hypothetical protein
MTAPGHEPITITEAASIVRAPVATLRYWRYLGAGPRSFRLGRRVVYRLADVQDGSTRKKADSPAPGATPESTNQIVTAAWRYGTAVIIPSPSPVLGSP